MSDDEAAAFYANPANLRTTGTGHVRSTKVMTRHVPVRFSQDMIEAVKVLADNDGMTVSSWIRQVVRLEIERREQPKDA